MGKTGGSVGRKRKKSSSRTGRSVKTLPTWKGDPNDKVAIAEWKKSYEPGYTPTIISPRDSSGKYTSKKEETVGYTVLTQVQHAREVALALSAETNVPTSIVDSLKKTLGKVKEPLIKKPPTATTLTQTKGHPAGKMASLIDIPKWGAGSIALLIIIVIAMKLMKK